MPTNKKPDLQTFLTDPAFEEDRALFGGFVDAHLEKRAEEARKKKEAEDAANANDGDLFSFIFGPKK